MGHVQRKGWALRLYNRTYAMILWTRSGTEEVGLHDERHFIREFKRAYGTTPGAYRRGIGTSDCAEAVAGKAYK
jgi:Bacterial regulatory helix-turn-helix proteins, AraC family